MEIQTSPATATEHKPRFVTLDALRGVAAISVLLFHGRGTLPFHAFGQAYLAVDFFFMLSGFVIGYAYEHNLLSGAVSKARFLTLRAIRLYPLIALGSMLGLACFWVQVWVGAETTTGHPFAASVLGAVAIPAPLKIANEPFPLNGPTWSLACEIGVNLLYLFLARWLRTSVVLAIALCALIAEMTYIWQFGSIAHVGATEGPSWAIVARTTFPFFAGLLIYRAGLHRRSRPGNELPLALTVVLVLLMCFPPLGAWSSTMEVASIVFIFPAIVALGAIRQPTGRLVSWAEKSADVSYPLYALHNPVVRTYYALIPVLGIGWRPRQIAFLLLAAGCIGAARWLAPRDEAFRQRLRAFLLPRRQSKTA